MDYHPLVRVLDEARAKDTSRPFRGGEHIIEREVELNEFLRLDLNLELPDFAAKDRHLCHARHGKQPLLDFPIRHGAQLHERAFLGDQPDRQHDAGRRSQRRHRGRLNALRQARGDGREPLGDHLPGAVNINARTKCDRD